MVLPRNPCLSNFSSWSLLGFVRKPVPIMQLAWHSRVRFFTVSQRESWYILTGDVFIVTEFRLLAILNLFVWHLTLYMLYYKRLRWGDCVQYCRVIEIFTSYELEVYRSVMDFGWWKTSRVQSTVLSPLNAVIVYPWSFIDEVLPFMKYFIVYRCSLSSSLTL